MCLFPRHYDLCAVLLVIYRSARVLQGSRRSEQWGGGTRGGGARRWRRTRMGWELSGKRCVAAGLPHPRSDEIILRRRSAPHRTDMQQLYREMDLSASADMSGAATEVVVVDEEEEEEEVQGTPG